MFNALLDRRWEKFRRDCFPTALLLAQRFNQKRGEGVEPRTPFSFLPGYEPKEMSRREQAQHNVKVYFSTLRDVDEETAAKVRLRVIANLKKAGHEDAEEMIDEIFVAWAKKLKEKKN